MVIKDVPSVELERLEVTLMVCMVELVTEVGG